MPARQRDPRGECGTFRYVDIASINRETKQIEDAKELACEEAPSRARKGIRVNDLLVSTVRPNLNAVAQVTAELDGQIASTGFAVLRPDPKRIHPRYLFFRVITDAFISDMVAQAKGAGYPAVSDRIVSNHKLPLPPLSEQHRIVEILDQADALRRQRREADELSKRILPALFQEMFGDLNYVSKSLGLLTTKIGSGATPRGGSLVYTDVGSLLIRSQNVHRLSIDLSDAVRISDCAFQALERVRVQRGDVLLNITGASIGRVAPVVTDIEPAVVNQHVCIIRTDFGQLNSFYLAFLLSTPRFQDFIVSASSGAAQAGFSHEKTKALEIPLPPLELQDAFAERFQRVLNTSQDQATCAATLETLFQTLLHRAFDGSLTAKWREGQGKELLQEMEKQA